MVSLLSATEQWRPVITISNLLPRHVLSQLRFCFAISTIGFGALALAAWLTPVVPYLLLWVGLGTISFGLWLEQIMIYSYHNARYYAGINSIINRDEHTNTYITYDVASIVLQAPDDLSRAFLSHPLGELVAKRAGITSADIKRFSTQTRHMMQARSITLDPTQTFSIKELGSTILQYDPDFVRLFEEKGITPEHVAGALQWVVEEHMQKRLKERWWSKDSLLRTPGIGTSWSYGYTRHINTFTKSIQSSSIFTNFGSVPVYTQEKAHELEQILVREKAGNVLILGEPGVGKADVIAVLENRIARNSSIAGLQHKRILNLDTERILANSENPTNLEQTIIKLCREALVAGNCILVIENLSTFITTALNRGVHVAEILDTYLSHPDITFIATDTPGGFHTHLQPLGALVRRFGQVVVDVPDTKTVTKILARTCVTTELKHEVFFTYPALVAIAQAAHRYITDGVPPDSALTLLIEVANAHPKSIITPETVHQFIKNKTGIPMGAIDEAERDVLLHLEETLHLNVIGQDVAIDAIANTIRRARVGIQNSERPMGSFLFLGPTGVGKTETAKTLAKVFFGNPDNMVRFDMSEYGDQNAAKRMIGNNQETGTLSTTLHDHPYTVLLLDEFEKADHSIHDLFLQILDEGQFTDGRGQHINARNTMIIATSNAGSDLIYNTTEQRITNPSLNQKIIDHIIKEGHFKPELINRFDNTIIFEPLTSTQQSAVADLMLTALMQRMREQGYHLQLDPSVSSYLLEHGYDSAFGARAMRREIQDSVEAVIADKIIANGLKPGDTITLQRSDLP